MTGYKIVIKDSVCQSRVITFTCALKFFNYLGMSPEKNL